ncbi:MAG: thioredoxin [Prolixibacteraceae bacterium]
MSINNRFKQIIKSHRPVLVDFYAEWCQPCRQLEPVLKAVKNTFKESIRILRVNVDHNQSIPSQFNVKNLPTLILFQSGSVKWVKEGMVETSELTHMISEYVEKTVQ